MDYRFVEWRGEIYIVLGIGYDTQIDPPDVFHCVPLESHSVIRSLLEFPGIVKIPFTEAIEITDKKRIYAIWVLFGSKHG